MQRDSPVLEALMSAERRKTPSPAMTFVHIEIKAPTFFGEDITRLALEHWRTLLEHCPQTTTPGAGTEDKPEKL